MRDRQSLSRHRSEHSTQGAMRSSRFAWVVALVSIVALTGCGGSKQHATTSADSTGTIVGRLGDYFAHGNPFYGIAVYLIPNSPRAEDWWLRLGRPGFALVDPDARRLDYADRTLCQNDFSFGGARPGNYYLYARGLGATPMGDSAAVISYIWIGSATVVAGETLRVTLKSLPQVSHGGNVSLVFPSNRRPLPPGMQIYGDYVYTETLPEAIHVVTPEYPPAARAAHIDGTVLIQVLVDAKGRVVETMIVKSIPALDHAADDAVRKYVFRPA